MGNIQLKVLRIGPKNYPPNHGGVEKNAYLLVKGMPDIENHIFTEWEPEIDYPRVMALPKGLFRQLRKARAYMKENSIDLVHLHKETFIPLGLLLKLTGHRCILTVHGCAWRLKRWPFHVRTLLFFLDCLACCLLDRTVFVGEYDWRLFKRIIFFRKLYLIRNGVDLREKPQSPGKGEMVYLGRISPEKNILSLINAAESSKITLDLYGPFDRHDPAYCTEVARQISCSSYVQWKGAVPFDATRKTLSMYRVFVNVSFSEGLPTSVLEASAEGLYLVLSDIPQHRLLEFPECIYVDPNNVLLTKAVLEKKYGLANRAHVNQFFSVNSMVQAYRKIYEECV